MKKLLLQMLFITLTCMSSFGASQIQIMAMPDDDWAQARNYGELGRKNKFIKDLMRCFNDPEYKQVEAALKAVFQSDQFNLIDPTSLADSDDEDEMEEMTLQDDMGGDVTSNANDDLISKYKPDILIFVSWTKNQIGPRYSITYRLDAKDSYSNKSIATVVGESDVYPMSQTLTGAMTALLNDKSGEFKGLMRNHFSRMREEGREVRLNCNIMSGSDVNFETRFGDKTLKSIITDWVGENVQTPNYTLDATQNRMRFRQVCIPLENASGRPYMVSEFVDKLVNYLEHTYGIQCTNKSRTLGLGRLIISGSR